MTKEKYEEFIKNLNIEKNKWYVLNDINSIIQKDGVGTYPKWTNLRFAFRENNILVCHGKPKIYGARLSTRFNVSTDRVNISFPPGSIVINNFETFREPKIGDIIVSSDGVGNILSESIITSIKYGLNMTTITVMTPVKLNQNAKLSFYDPEVKLSQMSIHGTIQEGIYIDFIPNDSGKIYNDLKYHEVIKVKNIVEINLNLRTKNKTYKIV